MKKTIKKRTTRDVGSTPLIKPPHRAVLECKNTFSWAKSKDK